MSYIRFQQKPSGEYAIVRTAQRVNGKRVETVENLGLVIDKDRGVFQNKKRGIFMYSIENGYKSLDETEYKSFAQKLRHPKESET
ncbi:MAG: hypothetical protein LBF84_00980 [Holosporales bacterium]|nr:hypothetical protein [Holosporales bacterium]